MPIKEELLQMLIKLENLNPDLTQTEINRLIHLAQNVGSEFFDEAATHAMKLAEMYLHSDVKSVGSEIMKEYFNLLEEGAKKLEASGEIAKAIPESTESTSFSTALVPKAKNEALDYCKILNRSVVPKALVKAADAFRRRNEVVDTVFDIALKVLWNIDRQKTISWIVALYNEKDGNLDPDIVRDTLSTALLYGNILPPEFTAWAIKFAADMNLLEYWPNVTRHADRLLCKNAIHAWFACNPPKSALLSQLRLYSSSNRTDDDTLLNWSKRSLDNIGKFVQRFMAIEKAEVDEKWRSVSIVSEIRRIADIFEPVLIVSDQIMGLPDGVTQLAMAFMGLAGESRDKWEEYLLKYSERAVKLMFLLDMKAKKKPLDTIKKLTFGDDAAYRLAYSELDLASENFDSPAQRDKITKFLAVFYASYRRQQILGYEIAKRYKSLMKLLHDDFLSQALNDEQLRQIHDLDIIPEITSIAAEARKYLAKRKADENTLEQMLAAKIEFERFVRQKRIAIIRKLLA